MAGLGVRWGCRWLDIMRGLRPPTPDQGVFRIVKNQRGGWGGSPKTPCLPPHPRPSWETTKFTIGKIWSGHFGTKLFGSDPLPLPRSQERPAPNPHFLGPCMYGLARWLEGSMSVPLQ